YPQDGSGVTDPDTIVVTSAAVEDTIPDVGAARRIGATLMLRAELLSQLFNESPNAIGVAGTSGKSTTTGMIGWILSACGLDPTVMNGAVMINFATPDAPFASALVGQSDLFVSEVDESDGSIARYHPRVAVLNLDNAESAALAAELPRARRLTYSLSDPGADLLAQDIEPLRDGIAFRLGERNGAAPIAVRLGVPGRHNVSNALAAIAAVRAAG